MESDRVGFAVVWHDRWRREDHPRRLGERDLGAAVAGADLVRLAFPRLGEERLAERRAERLRQRLLIAGCGDREADLMHVRFLVAERREISALLRRERVD